MSELLSESTPYRYDGSYQLNTIKFNDTTNHQKYKWNITGTNTRSGGTNPRWKKQVARGAQAGTSFEGERIRYLGKPFSITSFCAPKPGKVPQATRDRIRSWAGSLPISAPTSSAVGLSEVLANNRALEQLVTKIRKNQTTFQGGTFIGELVKTVRAIANPAQSLRRGVTHLVEDLKGLPRRIPTTRRRELLTAVRDTWLEYQLGFAPLLNEVDAAMQVAAESQVFGNRSIWKAIRAVGVDSTETTVTATSGHPSSLPNYKHHIIQRDEVVVRYIACVDIGTYSTADARRIGFAPTNWVPTLWELIPYSFVIDYFSNIGNIISAATLARSGTRWMMKTIRKSRKRFYSNHKAMNFADNATYTYTLGASFPGASSVERSQIIRAPYNGSLVPDLIINLPGSNTQWLNVAALYSARRELKSIYR